MFSPFQSTAFGDNGYSDSFKEKGCGVGSFNWKCVLIGARESHHFFGVWFFFSFWKWFVSITHKFIPQWEDTYQTSLAHMCESLVSLLPHLAQNCHPLVSLLLDLMIFSVWCHFPSHPNFFHHCCQQGTWHQVYSIHTHTERSWVQFWTWFYNTVQPGFQKKRWLSGVRALQES